MFLLQRNYFKLIHSYGQESHKSNNILLKWFQSKKSLRIRLKKKRAKKVRKKSIKISIRLKKWQHQSNQQKDAIAKSRIA